MSDEITQEAVKIMEEIGSSLEMVMLEMMERGYLIHGSNSTYSITKMATEADPKEVINTDPSCSTSISGFPSRAHAIKWFWDHKDDPSPVAERLAKWHAVVYYTNGLGPKFKDLEPVKAATYGEALELATAQAIAFVESDSERKKWGYKEVKVKPFEVQT